MNRTKAEEIKLFIEQTLLDESGLSAMSDNTPVFKKNSLSLSYSIDSVSSNTFDKITDKLKEQGFNTTWTHRSGILCIYVTTEGSPSSSSSSSSLSLKAPTGFWSKNVITGIIFPILCSVIYMFFTGWLNKWLEEI